MRQVRRGWGVEGERTPVGFFSGRLQSVTELATRADNASLQWVVRPAKWSLHSKKKVAKAAKGTKATQGMGESLLCRTQIFKTLHVSSIGFFLRLNARSSLHFLCRLPSIIQSATIAKSRGPVKWLQQFSSCGGCGWRL